MCTKGLVFEPSDASVPLARYPYRSMLQEPKLQGVQGLTEFGGRVLTIKCDTVVSMKGNNEIGPYRIEPVSNPKDYLVLFALEHTNPELVRTEIMPAYQACSGDDKRAMQRLIDDRMIKDFDRRCAAPPARRAAPTDR